MHTCCCCESLYSTEVSEGGEVSPWCRQFDQTSKTRHGLRTSIEYCLVAMAGFIPAARDDEEEDPANTTQNMHYSSVARYNKSSITPQSPPG